MPMSDEMLLIPAVPDGRQLNVEAGVVGNKINIEFVTNSADPVFKRFLE
jgi:hypothetical protein